MAEAARALRVTERTLRRRVLKATGLPVAEVARRVGHGGATAVRRLIRRNFRAAPRDLRRAGGSGGPRR